MVWRMAPQDTPEPLMVSVRDAAKMLATSEWTVRELCRAGELDARKHGTRIRIIRASLDKYVAELPSVSAS